MPPYRRPQSLSLNAPSPLATPVEQTPSASSDSLPTPTQQPDAPSPAPSTSSASGSKRKLRPSTSSRDSATPKRVRPSASAGIAKDYLPPSTRLADLGGVDSCIEQMLEHVALPLTHPELYTSLGVKAPRGVLLVGPPGCGKTMMAGAIAGELGLPFISVSAPSIVSGMSGESEKTLRETFEEAAVRSLFPLHPFRTRFPRQWKGEVDVGIKLIVSVVQKLAPCILFIDEIDAITPKRENAQREMERRIVAQLLTCLDGPSSPPPLALYPSDLFSPADLAWEKTDGKPVMVISATNRPDSLDPALRRAGRFDQEITMGVPDEAGRERFVPLSPSPETELTRLFLQYPPRPHVETPSLRRL